MESSKKILLSTIGIAVLIVIVTGVTFAFFNYTRTGASNNIKVGRISFVSKDEETITLNNLFPIDPENTTDMNDTTKVGTYQLTIEGDTDYSGGIEYLVSTTNSNLSNLPISINMTVGSGLGTNDTNYFTSRDTATTPIYKKIVGSEIVGDQMLLVGFIPQNTTLGTSDETGDTITIKAYLDKNKILISDTYDGTESDNMGTPNSLAQGKTVLTTTEWNSLSSTGVSFKIKVEANEGIWVKGSLEEIMKKDAVMDNVSSTYVSASSGIDFGAISSDTNGKGVYMRAGTENDAYPIMYYRGAVEDNNVLFNNKCWKAVRTTDTGGVKLIYNGELSELSAPLAESDYTILTNTGSMTFDTMDNAWVVHSTETIGSLSDAKEISFSVPNGDGYLLEIFGSSGSSISGDMYIGTSETYQYINGFVRWDGQPIYAVINFETMTTGNSIKVTYYGTGTSSQELVLKIRVIHPDETLGMGCDNQATTSRVTLSGTNTFRFSGTNLYKSLAYNGYMWGEVYEWTNEAATSGAYFGNGFEYSNGLYTLTNAKVGYDGTHHYSCNSTSIDGTCASIRYYYYSYYYITLTNGESVEDALKKMQTNTTDSNAKTQIDAWYASNMTGITSKLEDTIWCNDRSISSKAGWDPNGNVTESYLYYSAYDRANNTNVPSLSCANKNDAFTVSNAQGNQKLTYPVALLTIDEMKLAGGKIDSYSMFYLAGGTNYWSLSPYYFSFGCAGEFDVGNGYIGNKHVNNGTSGLRPAISLKPGQPIAKGNGTVADPYVIE